MRELCADRPGIDDVNPPPPRGTELIRAGSWRAVFRTRGCWLLPFSVGPRPARWNRPPSRRSPTVIRPWGMPRLMPTPPRSSGQDCCRKAADSGGPAAIRSPGMVAVTVPFLPAA